VGNTGDIILYDGRLAVYKHSLDLIFHLIANQDENELMISTALSAFSDAIHMLLRNQVEKRAVLENLDLVLLCLDETIDEGCVTLDSSPQRESFLGCPNLLLLYANVHLHSIIVETDPTTIASRVSRPRADTSEIVINEQTILSAYQTVKEKMTQRIAAGF
jgi:hypothetical protein